MHFFWVVMVLTSSLSLQDMLRKKQQKEEQ